MAFSKFERKAVRSDKYQYILVEVLFSSEAWNLFSEAQEKCLPLSDEKREVLLDWDRELKAQLHVMIDECLTPRQRQVLLLYADGYTQQEIAAMLDVNQSSITKSLNGNVDYNNGKRVYGGLKKKFIKIVKRNFAIRPIMKNIHLIWEPNSVRLPHYQTFRNILGTEDEFEKWLDEPFPTIQSNTLGLEKAPRGTSLTPKQILEIRQLHLDGIAQGTLMARYHIGRSRLIQIVSENV